MTPQSNFFDTFGYLYLPGLLADDIGWISEEFDAVWARRPDLHHDGVHRTIYPDAFFNASSILAQLIEHPLLSSICEELLGPDIAYYGGTATTTPVTLNGTEMFSTSRTAKRASRSSGTSRSHFISTRSRPVLERSGSYREVITSPTVSPRNWTHCCSRERLMPASFRTMSPPSH